jgi:hypothetical protein
MCSATLAIVENAGSEDFTVLRLNGIVSITGRPRSTAPDPSTWKGVRVRAIFHLAVVRDAPRCGADWLACIMLRPTRPVSSCVPTGRRERALLRNRKHSDTRIATRGLELAVSGPVSPMSGHAPNSAGE